MRSEAGRESAASGSFRWARGGREGSGLVKGAQLRSGFAGLAAGGQLDRMLKDIRTPRQGA